MPRAQARHILVKTEAECNKLKDQIAKGEAFTAVAQKFSLCPSGKKGGDLGEFRQGQMVREFDEIVFKDEVGKVHGPVKTQFGFHLIEIISRHD